MSEWSVATAPAQVGGSGGAGDACSEAAFVLTLNRSLIHSARDRGVDSALDASGEHAPMPTPLAGAGSQSLADENPLLFRREDQGPAGEGGDSLVDERCSVPQVSRGPL